MAELTALQTGGSKASLHSIPLLPSAPLCVSFPQFMLETSPQLLVPQRQGSLGKPWVGKHCPKPMGRGLSLPKDSRNMAPKPNSKSLWPSESHFPSPCLALPISGKMLTALMATAGKGRGEPLWIPAGKKH